MVNDYPACVIPSGLWLVVFSEQLARSEGNESVTRAHPNLHKKSKTFQIHSMPRSEGNVAVIPCSFDATHALLRSLAYAGNGSELAIYAH
jgi:hypothetical protein